MKKKSKKSQELNQSSPSMGNPKRRVGITEAENGGFIVNHSGGDLGYEGQDHVFSNAKDLNAHLSNHFGAKKSKGSANPLKDRKDRQRKEALAAIEGK